MHNLFVKGDFLAIERMHCINPVQILPGSQQNKNATPCFCPLHIANSACVGFVIAFSNKIVVWVDLELRRKVSFFGVRDIEKVQEIGWSSLSSCFIWRKQEKDLLRNTSHQICFSLIVSEYINQGRNKQNCLRLISNQYFGIMTLRKENGTHDAFGSTNSPDADTSTCSPSSSLCIAVLKGKTFFSVSGTIMLEPVGSSTKNNQKYHFEWKSHFAWDLYTVECNKVGGGPFQHFTIHRRIRGRGSSHFHKRPFSVNDQYMSLLFSVWMIEREIWLFETFCCSVCSVRFIVPQCVLYRAIENRFQSIFPKPSTMYLWRAIHYSVTGLSRVGWRIPALVLH